MEKSWAWSWAWTLLFLVFGCCRCDGQVVTVAGGQLKGVLVEGQGGARDYYAFRGVRYAAAPVGALRFKAPRPVAPWEGVADATVEGNMCPQVYNGEVLGAEDCLNLNVYTPSLDCPAEGFAVIVFFHGGSLILGSNRYNPNYGPDLLVHHDVVVVLPNYRLGALGFTNLDTSGVPGNAGIKDGLAALRWVRDNAASFCGDPARVTAMGQSAGSKLVAFLALTASSKGLFRAAIQMSGTANSPLAYTEQHVQRARDLAGRLGGNASDAASDTASVERTLLEAPWDDIARHSYDMFVNTAWGLSYNPFVASPERRPADGEEVALPRDPESLLRDPPVPRVPTLTGVASGEGISFTDGTLHDEHKMEALATNLKELLRVDIAYVGTATATQFGVATTPSPEVLDEIARRVKDKYFQGQDPSADYPEGLAHLVGDMRYVYPLYRWARHLDRGNASLYLYLFDQVTEFNYNLPIGTHVAGAAHADDLAYIFYVTASDLCQDLQGSGVGNDTLRAHLKLVTDFAKNLTAPELVGYDVAALGSPSSDLRARPPYLYVGKTFRETRIENTLGAQERMEFWDDILGLMLDAGRRSGSRRPLPALPAEAVVALASAFILRRALG